MRERRNRSSLSMRAVVFLALLLPVWALGVVRGQRLTGSIGAMPPFFGEDLARFERARPRLAASERLFLLVDRPVGLPAGERFFAAQYSLAPTVLSLAVAVETVVGSDWQGDPRLVLCAFDDPARRAEALAKLEAGARSRGVAYAVEPIDDVLTLVRLGEL